MALNPNGVSTRESADDIEARFRIAQHGTPTPEQLAYQADIAEAFVALAQVVNRDVADGRAKSLALTALEEALMWTGKAVFS